MEWLAANHPNLAELAERDRDWVWLAINLSGDTNKPTREAIKAFGFRFAKRGHVLPSSRTAFWGNACQSPIPFRRKPKGSSPTNSNQPNASATSASAEALDSLDPELAAFLQS